MDFPETLQQAIQYFSDEQVCIDAVASLRWPDGPECPDCTATKEPVLHQDTEALEVSRLPSPVLRQAELRFRGFAHPVAEMASGLWMLVNCKNGVSSYELAKDLGIHQKSAWFVLHRLRLALKNNSPVQARRAIPARSRLTKHLLAASSRTCTRTRKFATKQRGGGTARPSSWGCSTAICAKSAQGRSEREARDSAK